MTTSLWCLMVVAILPYVLSTAGGYFRFRQFDELDNKNPRAQSAALEGLGARIYAAQQNAWEALPFFAAAVLVANLGGADPDKAGLASIVFLGTRVLHPILYAANLDVLRSVVFLIGLASGIRLFLLGL
jgi:uncharacterized MAPEG superfamily protein